MRQLAILLGLTAVVLGAGARVDIYSANDLGATTRKLAQKKAPFAAQDLERYGNHYTMLAYRRATGSAEVHQHEADVFIVESGNATLLTGGRMVNAHVEKPGELRGASIDGGERHQLAPGDIIHIPAGVPHQLLVEKGKPFAYFVVKVTGQ
jgi:mannose-6-phosphate isomerase-like protein (cupin superfamily)